MLSSGYQSSFAHKPCFIALVTLVHKYAAQTVIEWNACIVCNSRKTNNTRCADDDDDDGVDIKRKEEKNPSYARLNIAVNISVLAKQFIRTVNAAIHKKNFYG